MGHEEPPSLDAQILGSTLRQRGQSSLQFVHRCSPKLLASASKVQHGTWQSQLGNLRKEAGRRREATFHLKKQQSSKQQASPLQDWSASAMDTSQPPAPSGALPAEAAPARAAAAAMHPQPNLSPPAPSSVPMEVSSGPSTPTQPPGPSSMSSAMGLCSPAPLQTIHEEHFLVPGQWTSGNLWNFPLRPEVLEDAGPLGSLTRRTTTLASPNVQRHATTGVLPVRDVVLANIIAHQKYLEMLSFEQHTLHQRSRMISEQIIAEPEQVHGQLATMLEKIAAHQQVNAWTRAQSSQSMAPRPMSSPPAQPSMGSIEPPQVGP